MNHHLGRWTAGLVLGVAVVAACSGEPTPAASPSSDPRPSSAPSPSASPSASPRPLLSACPGRDPTPSRTGTMLAEQRSRNWAGYVIYDRRRSISCVEGAWTHPSITCPARGEAHVAIWVGIDGVTDQDALIEAGDTLVQIGTDAGCADGEHRDFAWYQVIPEDALSVHVPEVPVQAGDLLRAIVLWSDGVFTLQLVNETRGASFLVERPLEGSARQTAEWIVEAPTIGCPSECHVADLPAFDTLVFGDTFAALDELRGSISDDAWAHVATRIATGSTVRAVPSRLMRAGTSFVVTWQHR